MADKRELRITVWQFVRIMVSLEDRRKRPLVYDDWKAAWHELDGELTRLGHDDQVAYSDLMMNQEVVLEFSNDKRRGEIRAALERVMQRMKRELRVAKSGKEERRSLKFELDELSELHRTLK
jgi:hypothetical protein